ncbi:universal stress protein [Halosolutus gelatinilyticus]|uniref:universal stress protein n=1 Tax=Halosolutus gelatinilyticus TaxID=2931975 RepID=UPI001FF2CCC8|nr:universal stress protein [Halosolutus gelatinilyticus]
MGDRILVPIDGGSLAAEALAYAFRTFPDASVVALHVIDPQAGINRIVAGETFEGWYEDANRETDALFEDAQRIAAEHDREMETVRELGDTARTIVSFADETDADGVVIGSHGREGAARFLLGSVAEHVVRRSPVPVTVVR